MDALRQFRIGGIAMVDTIGTMLMAWWLTKDESYLDKIYAFTSLTTLATYFHRKFNVKAKILI